MMLLVWVSFSFNLLSTSCSYMFIFTFYFTILCNYMICMRTLFYQNPIDHTDLSKSICVFQSLLLWNNDDDIIRVKVKAVIIHRIPCLVWIGFWAIFCVHIWWFGWNSCVLVCPIYRCVCVRWKHWVLYEIEWNVNYIQIR